MHVTQTELADLFDVTPRTIQRWGPKGLDEARVDGNATYDLKRAISWRVEQEQADEDDAYRVARTRLTEAKADEAEREGRVRAGELLELDDVAQLVRAPLEAANRTLKAAPRRHARKLARIGSIPEAEALELLEAIVEEVRTDLRESDA